MHWRQRDADAYLDGELGDKRRAAYERHVDCCTDCRVQLEDRRRLKRRLAALSGPAAPAPLPDASLVRRLSEGPVSPPGWTGLEDGQHARPLWRAAAPLLAATVVAVLVVGVLGAGWALGGAARSAGDDPSRGWDAAGVALSGEDLGRLRDAGWNCPRFVHLGLGLDRATGRVVDGEAEVVLEFSGAEGSVVVAERRGPPDGAGAAATGPAPAPAAAGEPARLEPFGVSARRTSGELRPHTTTLRLPTAEYSITADVPESSREAVVHRVVVSENARLATGPEASDDGGWERVMRGLSRLMVLEPGA